jgi:hypothetical protein
MKERDLGKMYGTELKINGLLSQVKDHLQNY